MMPYSPQMHTTSSVRVVTEQLRYQLFLLIIVIAVEPDGDNLFCARVCLAAASQKGSEASAKLRAGLERDERNFLCLLMYFITQSDKPLVN